MHVELSSLYHMHTYLTYIIEVPFHDMDITSKCFEVVVSVLVAKITCTYYVLYLAWNLDWRIGIMRLKLKPYPPTFLLSLS